MSVRDVVQAAAGALGGDKVYVEDVFSTYLYTGNGSTQTITNGIDLAGEGGMVWTKSRSAAYSNGVYDTERGATKEIKTDATTAESTDNGVTAFSSTGYSIGARFTTNSSGETYASWTFRKAPKFFDVVTYTGNNTGQSIPHNLGSVPGCILIKEIDGVSNWGVYHRGIGATKFLNLNATDAATTYSNVWNDTEPTDAVFTVGNETAFVNNANHTYVAYLFAHDAGGFGDDGNQNIISCGSYEGNGTTQSIDIGFEPQWLLIKPVDQDERWLLFDTMRGLSKTSSAILRPDVSDAEGDPDDFSQHWVDVYANGFFLDSGNVNYYNFNARTYIYIAIRRPMKTPTSGTEVLDVVTSTQALNASNPAPSSITDDFLLVSGRTSGTVRWDVGDRLRGSPFGLFTNTTDAEVATGFFEWDTQTGVKFGDNLKSSADLILYHLRRAPGFFDVVAYTGTGSARTVAHNLGVAPDLLIVKGRNNPTAFAWVVYSSTLGATQRLELSTTVSTGASSIWDNTEPTSSVFTVSGSGAVNGLNVNYIAYLFATLAGVSKVGSYTGTAANLDVDCGFSAGARFILIKRTDSTGDWYVWDSARGITAGNDPYLLLNSSAAQVTSTDYIDPLSSGFTVTSSAPAGLNASGGTYIFLAIA